ncbi:MAG TPA: EcsC family protein [Thermoleophilaceae bacterium]|nr:EcsC family protein [Thermoleophilaceae bacterium]
MAPVEPLPPSLWEKLRADPERAAEHLALAASARFAAPAARWAREGSHRPPAELARDARRNHVRLSIVEGAALGLGGALTTAADLAALAWIQSRMVFFVAASYGFEPDHPMRPAELLALQGMYETAAEARAALDGSGTPLAVKLIGARLRPGSDGRLARALLRVASRRLAQHTALRAVPLVASPLNAVANRAGTKALGDRAIRFYGG